MSGRVLVSISYGDTDNPTVTKTTHMSIYEGEVSITGAKLMADSMVNALKDSGFGVYKEEFPSAVHQSNLTQ